MHVEVISFRHFLGATHFTQKIAPLHHSRDDCELGMERTMSENQLLSFVKFQVAVNASLVDKDVVAVRHELADFTSSQFAKVAIELRKANVREEQKKIDSAVALILEIGSSLISGANALFSSGNTYAAAALVRQLVEVEYLAWAFEEDNKEVEKWITSDKEERMKFFTPAKLRKAAQGRFRSKDYGYHCELGGHPVPGANVLLENSELQAQLLLSDMLGHSGRIWDHLIGWADGETKKQAVLSQKEHMLEKYVAWKKADVTTRMPPPP